MRNRKLLVIIGTLALAGALTYAARQQRAASTGLSASHGEAPSRRAAAVDVEEPPRRAASTRDERAAQLRETYAALARLPPPSNDVVRHEREVLELQQVESASAPLRTTRAYKDSDPLSLARADELVTSYARERKQILAAMYDAYLKHGATYDPAGDLRAMDEAAEKFSTQAAQLEGQIPGVGALGQMLEITSLKRPAFLDELHAGEDEGV